MKHKLSRNGNSEAEALELVKKAREEREQKCNAEVQGILKVHNCQIVPVVQIGEQFVQVDRVINFTTGYVVSSQ